MKNRISWKQWLVHQKDQQQNQIRKTLIPVKKCPQNPPKHNATGTTFELQNQNVIHKSIVFAKSRNVNLAFLRQIQFIFLKLKI